MPVGFSKYAYGVEPARYAFDNVSAGATAEELVAAVSEKRIRVLALAFVCGATATEATFGSAGTDISTTFRNAANGGAVLGFNQVGWFETEEGQSLTLTTGAGSITGVQVVYALH